MKISIVIPACNEEKYIGRTLESIKKLDEGKYDLELVVIDGGSSDKTVTIASSYGAHVYTIPHKGIGFARQQGVKYATGDIILFTDADTIVPQDWLIKHVEALMKPNVVFTYGTFRVIDGKFPYYHYINYIQPHWLWVMQHIFGWPIAAGQNLAFWKDKADAIGGFDETLPLFEDIDFAVRMKKTGKVVFLHDLIVQSSGRRSEEGWGFFLRMAAESLKYFFIGKHSLKIFPDFR